MKIGIIGSGNMGSALAKRIALAGHDVLLTAKDRAKAEAVASGIGPTVRVLAAGDVARDADIVIAATPAGSQAEALRSAGDLNGKTVIDIANPLKPDMSGLSVGYTTSFA